MRVCTESCIQLRFINVNISQLAEKKKGNVSCLKLHREPIAGRGGADVDLQGVGSAIKTAQG